MNNLNKVENSNQYQQPTTVSMVDYKDRANERIRKIREFEEGPQAVVGCTCGGHTDPDEFLTEREATNHYLKDRARYVETLKGEDPMGTYMETFEEFSRNIPFIQLSRQIHSEDTVFQQGHLNLAKEFYENHIVDDPELTDQTKMLADKLKSSYEGYKKFIVRRLRGVYIHNKASIIRANYCGDNEEISNYSDKDCLDIDVYDAKGYAKLINKHFYEADESLINHTISIASKTLNEVVDKKLNGDPISDRQIKKLGDEMDMAFVLMKQVTEDNTEQNYEYIENRYERLKDECSIEYKAEMLIELELLGREIDGCYEYDGTCGFTVNNSSKQLIETIGMEIAIEDLATKELETLLEQFKAMEL